MSKDKQEKLINDVAQEIAPVISKIEKQPKLTQNHYGRYAALLSKLAGNDKRLATLYAVAFIRAGANRSGVANALKIAF